MESLAQKKLALWEWIAGQSEVEVDNVCRLLVEHGHGIGALPHTGNSLFKLPPDVFSVITETVSWWTDLYQLRATCRWLRVHAVGSYQGAFEAMRMTEARGSYSGGIHVFAPDGRVECVNDDGDREDHVCCVNLERVSACTNLRTLDLSATQVDDVSGLSTCTNLHTLDLSYTQVSDVSELSTCTNLRLLDLRGAQVSISARVGQESALATCTNLILKWQNPTWQ